MNNRSPFWGVLFFLVAFYLFMRLGYATFAGWVAAPGWLQVKEGLPTGGQEFPLYFGLALLGCVAYLGYDIERWRAFRRPLYALLSRAGWRRTLALVAFPVAVGGWVFAGALGGGGEPVVNPLRHPTPPEDFSRMTNPFRHPTPQMLEAFAAGAKAGALSEENTAEEAVLRYLLALQQGAVPTGLLEEAFARRSVEEGRHLYQVNCRPCHGTKAMGDGTAIQGQRRAPADFSGVETIATLVEGAVFWRIKKGGIGLPAEGAPWESAMPAWETELSDEDIWKIILAEYDTAGNRPRETEKHE